MGTPIDSGALRLSTTKMFDSIASRYDLTNRVLSFRRDVAWRRRLARLVAQRPTALLLDLATGTGDVLLALAERGAAERAVGCDVAGEMLGIARTKLAQRGLAPGFSVTRGNAVGTSFRDNAFDALTIAFGIRNVSDVPAALREMHRVLKPGGRVFVLEFSLPTNALVRLGYLTYFRHFVPLIGGWLGRNRPAYTYLNRSVEQFPSGAAFCSMLEAAGFTEVVCEPLTFGIASIYQGVKPIG